jgi:hypothetical protein
MTTARLHIDLSQGRIEAEGEVGFVMQVYSDFKDLLAKGGPVQASADGATELALPAPKSSERARTGGRSPRPPRPSDSDHGDAASAKVTRYRPSRDTTLDLSRLAEFVRLYEPKNASEKIVLYVQFLSNQGFEPCRVNQIYSCFLEMKDKIPKAFGQVLINTRSGKYGYIDFTSVEDVRLTTVGINQFNHKIAKKPPVA